MADRRRISANPPTLRMRALALGIAACGAWSAVGAANALERYRYGSNLEAALGWCWAAILIYLAGLAWRG